MSRSSRTKSSTGIYHIMVRGADRRNLFLDDQDCRKFIKCVEESKSKSDFNLYAMCLMGNHIHMLIKENEESLETIFKRIGSAYVYYYNAKYELRGHLFQDRFKSEPVETDEYFLDVLRYICQNPVKAGFCNNPEDYKWLGCSMFMEKLTKFDDIEKLINCSKDSFVMFLKEPCNNDHLDDSLPKRLTDKEAINIIKQVCGCNHVMEIGGWEYTKRDIAIKTALKNGISIRQLSRLTGISKSAIARI